MVIAVLVAAFCGTAQSSSAPVEPRTWFSIDAGMTASPVLSFAVDGPSLFQLSLSAIAGLELRRFDPLFLRIEASFRDTFDSTISSDWQLYQGWQAARFATFAGFVLPEGLRNFSLLGGGALSAAVYTGTPLVFAYPSALLELRLDPGAGRSGPRFGLPVELAFRGALKNLSAGFYAGYRFSPARKAGAQ
jgi:hypothetical protein